jgi:WD40 repeat protein
MAPRLSSYFQVNCSAFSPDGRTLLTASEDGCVYGWETQSRRLLWRLGGHTGVEMGGPGLG